MKTISALPRSSWARRLSSALRWRMAEFAYLSVVFAAMATTMVTAGPWVNFVQTGATNGMLNLFWFNVMAVSLMGLFWLGVDLGWQRRHSVSFQRGRYLPAVRHVAALVALGLLMLVVACLVIGAALYRTFESTATVVQPAG